MERALKLVKYDSLDELTIFKKKYEREKSARKQAEQLLEEKSRELYDVNVKLAQLNESLEEQVANRTKQLQ